MNRQPKISVITVCLNSEATIAETISSVKNQEFENYEHIIFDGGSKDNTLKIVEEKAHSKMYLIKGRDSGIYDAMNQAAKSAKGEVLHFLNSDDLYVSNSILKDVANTFLNTDQKILCTGIKYFDTQNPNVTIRLWTPSAFSRDLIEKGWHPPHPGFFCRREVFDTCAGFNCKFTIVADFDFMIRACASYPNYVSVSNMTTVRMRAGGASDQNIISTLKNNLDVCRSLCEQGFKIYRPIFILRRLFEKAMQFGSGSGI
jgi:glycosyltransferase